MTELDPMPWALTWPDGSHGSRMADLGADRRALGVDSVGESSESGHRLGTHPDLVRLCTPARSHRAVGHRGHPDATGGCM